MKRTGKFLALFFLLAVIIPACGGYLWSVRYDPPIPAKSYYENVNFKFYIYDWKEFQEIVKFYYGEPQPGTVGITIIRSNGERIVIVPRNKDGTIDLETLGHEIFYHVINDDRH